MSSLLIEKIFYTTKILYEDVRPAKDNMIGFSMCPIKIFYGELNNVNVNIVSLGGINGKMRYFTSDIYVCLPY